MITFNYTRFFLFVLDSSRFRRGLPCPDGITRLMRDLTLPNEILQVQPWILHCFTVLS